MGRLTTDGWTGPMRRLVVGRTACQRRAYTKAVELLPQALELSIHELN